MSSETVEITLHTYRRQVERRLLYKVFLIVGLMFVAVMAAKSHRGQPVFSIDIALLALFFIAFAIGHLFMQAIGFRGDQLLFPLAALLSGIGFVFQYRLGILCGESITELGSIFSYALPMGIFLFFIALFSRGRVIWLNKVYVWGFMVAIAGTIFMIFWGDVFRGATYGPGLTTPLELLKVFFALFLVGFILKHKDGFTRTIAGVPMLKGSLLVRFLFVWLAPQLLFLLTRDLGMLIQYNLLLVLLLLAVTGRSGYLLVGGIIVALLGYMFYSHVPYAADRMAIAGNRFKVWMDPWDFSDGAGYQIVQSLFALNAGGFWGTGIGLGYPNQVPIVQTDFIYASVAEELGFFGGFALLIMFLLFISLSARIAREAREPFVRYLVLGFTYTIAICVLLNLAGVVKLIPITGVPLPFISKGGSSLVATFAMLGIIVASSDR